MNDNESQDKHVQERPVAVDQSPTTIPTRNIDDPTAVETTTSTTTTTSSAVSMPRSTIGQAMDQISHVVNDNLITARVVAFSSIALLTAYGISQTPLFFRYRTVAEIPRTYFVGRRRLYGRIIKVQSNSIATTDGSDSVQVLVRNLSPIGLLLPTKWFDFLMKISPSRRLSQGPKKVKPEENTNELLKIRIAGIEATPVSRDSYNPQQFLERLAKDRTLVSCQLLGRDVPVLKDSNGDMNKRQISAVLPELKDSHNELSQILDPEAYDGQQIAICKLRYRPTRWNILSTDIAETLVKAGNANVASAIFQSSVSITNHTKIVDSSQRIQDLRKDVKYLDRLAKYELDAAKQSMGMWSVPEVREMKKEIIEEVDFQKKANIFQKLWRWIRGD